MFLKARSLIIQFYLLFGQTHHIIQDGGHGNSNFGSIFNRVMSENIKTAPKIASNVANCLSKNFRDGLGQQKVQSGQSICSLNVPM